MPRAGNCKHILAVDARKPKEEGGYFCTKCLGTFDAAPMRKVPPRKILPRGEVLEKDLEIVGIMGLVEEEEYDYGDIRSEDSTKSLLCTHFLKFVGRKVKVIVEVLSEDVKETVELKNENSFN